MLEPALQSLEASGFVRRLWQRDPSLWTDDAHEQELVKQRLGWLDVTETLRERVDELDGLARATREHGFERAVLLGMGGSSLAPEVMACSLPRDERQPPLIVLDTTDPETIAVVATAVDPRKTLVVVSSKSGTTIETLSLFAYFFELFRESLGDGAGQNFLAITDPGTPLEELARSHRFWKCFLNPPDIGGRYAALSYVGLVPAAVTGVDTRAVLDRAAEMVAACDSCVGARENPGAWLGAVLGGFGGTGRNKVTVVTSPPIVPLGGWIEQLLAESTGKEGGELVPVPDEPPAGPERYGDDRIFVYLHLAGDTTHDRWAAAIERAGLPLVRIDLRDRLDIAAEFFRWEFATAVAGSLLRLDPFDEPHVQESKDNTNRLLRRFEDGDGLDEPLPSASEGSLQVFDGESVRPGLRSLLQAARAPAYFAVVAYCRRDAETESRIRRLIGRVHDRRGAASTMGFGPRYLHSTGQLHKGGSGEGVFLYVTASDTTDLPIPGRHYTFSVLKRAQALGDLEALRRRGKKVLRVHITGEPELGLDQLLTMVEEVAEELET